MAPNSNCEFDLEELTSRNFLRWIRNMRASMRTVKEAITDFELWAFDKYFWRSNLQLLNEKSTCAFLIMMLYSALELVWECEFCHANETNLHNKRKLAFQFICNWVLKWVSCKWFYAGLARHIKFHAFQLFCKIDISTSKTHITIKKAGNLVHIGQWGSPSMIFSIIIALKNKRKYSIELRDLRKWVLPFFRNVFVAPQIRLKPNVYLDTGSK